MRQERDSIEERFAQAEAEVRRLNTQLGDLREQWEKDREQQTDGLKDEYEALKKAVLDYVIAYGAVEVQVALLHARRDTDGVYDGMIYENLRRCLEEQADALHALRVLARNLQTTDRPARD
ncbi:MAG: hypothetical protein SFU56_15620 [Capsulimonadales bacterium]|nr:hypothetical protein [Capsulimonadales bacterium]